MSSSETLKGNPTLKLYNCEKEEKVESLKKRMPREGKKDLK